MKRPSATEEKARPLVKLRSGKYIGDWAHGRLALFYEDGMVCRDLDPHLETELARMLILSETEARKDDPRYCLHGVLKYMDCHKCRDMGEKLFSSEDKIATAGTHDVRVRRPGLRDEPQNPDCGVVRSPAITATPSAKKQSTKEAFDEIVGGEDGTPLERLRLFCSLAMNGDDWPDVEPFFDAVERQLHVAPSSTGALVIKKPAEGQCCYGGPITEECRKSICHNPDRWPLKEDAAPSSRGMPEGVKLAFSIKTDGEWWYIHGEELVPGLNVVSQDFSKILADVIPSWAVLHKHAPQQVPPPPIVAPSAIEAIPVAEIENAAPQVAREREQGGTPMTSSPAAAAPLSAIEPPIQALRQAMIAIRDLMRDAYGNSSFHPRVRKMADDALAAFDRALPSSIERSELGSGHFHVWKEKWRDGNVIGQECFCGAERRALPAARRSKGRSQ